MAEEVKDVGEDPNKKVEGDPGQKKDEGGEEEIVPLTSSQYNALLDHVADLEAQVMDSRRGSKEIKKLDDLIEEGEDGPQRRAAPRDTPIEEMTPQQVLQSLVQGIHQNLIRPIEMKVETMRVMLEIERTANKKGNEDFWEYGDAVREIAMRNPTLSIQEAYELAKSRGTRKKGEPSDVGLVRKSGVLHTLPLRKGTSVQGGEKPGASRATMKGPESVSRRDAASEAFDAVMGGKKE